MSLKKRVKDLEGKAKPKKAQVTIGEVQRTKCLYERILSETKVEEDRSGLKEMIKNCERVGFCVYLDGE
jgi:hypothetical protein